MQHSEHRDQGDVSTVLCSISGHIFMLKILQFFKSYFYRELGTVEIAMQHSEVQDQFNISTVLCSILKLYFYVQQLVQFFNYIFLFVSTVRVVEIFVTT